LQVQKQIQASKDWYTWTAKEIEDNLNLLQAQAVDYLKDPFDCDCFVKHSSMIRGYCNEMQSFAKTQEERELLSKISKWADSWHEKFKKEQRPPKEVMQKLHDETRLVRKEFEEVFYFKKRDNPSNPGKHKLECKHGKSLCVCVIREHPKEHFDPKSFRRMKDYPKKGYDTVIGCPKGKFRKNRCQVGTQLHKIIAPMSKCKSSSNPVNPENDQDLLGRTGSMAELHDLLVERGFYYDHREGTPDTKEGHHQVGYTLVYKNRKNDIVRFTLIEKGLPSRKVHKVISPMMTKVREAGTADSYEITNVVTMD